MLEQASDAPGPRAFLRVGGKSVARHQLDMALALECHRIICIAEDVTNDIIELQHVAEAGRLPFHVISRPRALLGLVGGEDELIVFNDGFFAPVSHVKAAADRSPFVLVQPVQTGLAMGFERVDAKRAGAGLMRLPGRVVSGLDQLPPDCDAVASLQRLALQASVPTREVPAALAGNESWTIISSEGAADVVEQRWVNESVGTTDFYQLSRNIAAFAVRRIGPALLHARRGERTVAFAALVLLLLAISAAWFAFPIVALLLVGAGWLVRESAVMLASVNRDHEFENSIAIAGYPWLADAAIITILAWNLTGPNDVIDIKTYFPPLMLMSLLRVVPALLRRKWTRLFEDRLAICLMLAVGFQAGVPDTFVLGAAAALAIAVAIITTPRRS